MQDTFANSGLLGRVSSMDPLSLWIIYRHIAFTWIQEEWPKQLKQFFFKLAAGIKFKLYWMVSIIRKAFFASTCTGPTEEFYEVGIHHIRTNNSNWKMNVGSS